MYGLSLACHIRVLYCSLLIVRLLPIVLRDTIHDDSTRNVFMAKTKLKRLRKNKSFGLLNMHIMTCNT